MLQDGVHIDKKRFKSVCAYIMGNYYSIFDFLHNYIKTAEE